MNVVLSLGIILLTGLLAAKLLHRIKFPAVTAYILMGVLVGPTILNLVSKEILNASGLISNVVLGVIAFGLGQNFSRENFSKIGKSVLWISVLEATGAWLSVFFVFLFLLRQPLYLSLLFGAIASATAPAATVMVVRECGAKGIFTNTLLGIVAIDDAWCLIIFAFSLAVAKVLIGPLTGNLLLLRVLLGSLLHIGGAFLLGAGLAVILMVFSRYARTETDLLIYTLGFILFGIGTAIYFHLSVLLTNIFLGAVLVNINKRSFRFFDVLRTVDSPLYLCFFVLAGANLNVALLGKLGLIGVFYFLFRIIGKLTGASLGGYFSKAIDSVRKYLGFALIPQAGVALGVALIAEAEFPELGGIIFTTIATTTIIYELIGPFGTKFALSKAGQIGGD